MSDTDTGGAVDSGSTETGSEDTASPQEGHAQQSGKVQASQPSKAELKELAQESLDQLVSMKVNGQVKKMTVREALKQAELGQGAHLKMQEAAKDRKEYQRLIKLAKEDPDSFLAENGNDLDEYAEKRLVNKYTRMAESPEQRAQREKEERLQKYESQEKQVKDNLLGALRELVGEIPKGLEKETPERIHAELQRAQHVLKSTQQTLEKEVIEAWETTGLPKDPLFGQWMAALMHSSQVQKNQGHREEALQAKDASAIVKQNFVSAVQAITGKMTPQEITQLLGSENMKRLREFDVQRVTGKAGPTFERQNSPGQKPASSGNKKISTMDENSWNSFFRNIR